MISHVGTEEDKIVRDEFQIKERTLMPDIYCNPNSANVFQRGTANGVVVAQTVAAYNQKILARVLDVSCRTLRSIIDVSNRLQIPISKMVPFLFTSKQRVT